MTNVTVVVGGQFGSEGKGAITGHLAKQLTERDLVVRVAGPNAGHTAYDPQGREWKLRAVPVAAVTNPNCQLHIAAGSEVDPGVLFDELYALDGAGHRASQRLTIHPSATLLTQEYIQQERADGIVGRIGSTGKGIGAARANRIMRKAATYEDYARAFQGSSLKLLGVPGPLELDGADRVIIEGTQGYGLGLHTRFYPQVTSSDCRAIDFLAMAGVSPWASGIRLDVIVVARIFPIRVAGNSGPLLGETTWADLDLPDEHTTVTNKVRRVGSWDQGLIEEAILANGGGNFHPDVQVALTMLDQIHPEIRDETELPSASESFVSDLERRIGAYITLVGTGPSTVVER